MLRVYCLESIQRNNAVLFSSGYFSKGTHNMPNQAMDLLIKDLRPQLIPLAEIQMFPDEVLPSAIGNSYGDIYET
jgi:hypothetical protein